MKPNPKIAFNTANLVGRVTQYRFELRHWGEQHQRTIRETNEAEWAAICREIAIAGFHAVEVWEAHASPQTTTEERALLWKRIMEDAGLTPIAYAGALNEETTRVCQWMGIPHIDGGMGGLLSRDATALCQETGVRYNFENHPEKSASEVLNKIGGGNEMLGVCADLGWLGTQGVDAPAFLRELGPLVRHVHVKDVAAVGAHDTCLLGDGVVNVDACMDTLKEIGYTGWYSWEDEPEHRNPFDSAARNLRWIEERL